MLDYFLMEVLRSQNEIQDAIVSVKGNIRLRERMMKESAMQPERFGFHSRYRDDLVGVEMLLRGLVDPTTCDSSVLMQVMMKRPYIADAVRRFALCQTSDWEDMLNEILEKTTFPSSAGRR